MTGNAMADMDPSFPELRVARWRAVIVAMLAVATLMFVYEFVKTWIFPALTIWESHAITIVFSTFVGTVATWASLRRLDRLHRDLQKEEQRRRQLQERSQVLADRATELEHMNTLLGREIAERRRLEQQLVHSQKMESIGRLAGGIAHDFNNLLSVMITGIDLARTDAGKGLDIRADLDTIHDAAESAAELTRRLLLFARHQPHEPKVADLHAMMRHSLPMLQRLVGETITLEARLEAPDAHVRIDRAQFDQVIFNLVLNGADAMPEGGRLALRTRPHSSDGTTPESIVIDVTDTGHGIAEESRSRLFEPFFTTKPVGKGTGLGLATSYGIVTAAFGSIEAFNNVAGPGATFRVVLPIAEGPVEAVREQPREAFSLESGTILLVEDEPRVRDIARRVLSSRGLTVLTAEDGVQALERARSHDGPIDMLLTDVVMPRLGGRALAAALRQHRPSLPVLFMSGYTDSSVVGEGMSDAEFIQKPFSADALASRVSALLRGAR